MIRNATSKKIKEPTFRVIWEIDIEGGPRTEWEAAQEALEIMQDRSSTATVFKVYKNGSKKPKVIDLMLDEDDKCNHCRKCGETICGNDTTNYSCFEE